MGNLIGLLTEAGYAVHDYGDKIDAVGKECIAFMEPRFPATKETFARLPFGTTLVGYPAEFSKELLEDRSLNYWGTSTDDLFMKQTNELTALAMRQVIVEKFGRLDLKILIVGWGRLCEQLEKVFEGVAQIHILTFSESKAQALKKKYGKRGHVGRVSLARFDVVINTSPGANIGADMLMPIAHNKKRVALHDVASAPYGFNWDNVDREKFDYVMEPHLPARFFPVKAAGVMFDVLNRKMQELGARSSVVLCLSGSSCTFDKIWDVLDDISPRFNIIPVMSTNANISTRFVRKIDEFREKLERVTGNKIIDTIAGAEPLSHNVSIVASLVLPATGNTVARLTQAITDTPITMAVKALLRNSKPCIIGISTNDALSGNAKNIGELLNRKGYYFVPFGQDNPSEKPFSMVGHFQYTLATIESALEGKQLQPILRNH